MDFASSFDSALLKSTEVIFLKACEEIEWSYPSGEGNSTVHFLSFIFIFYLFYSSPDSSHTL